MTRNPILAEVFYRAGLIEKWGRGTNRVVAQCRQAGIAPPEFREAGGSVVVAFQVEVGRTVTEQVAPHVTPQVTPQVTPHVVAVLQAAQKSCSREELQQVTGLKDRMHYQRSYLEPRLSAGWPERTIPEKPRSRFQRYRTTF